LICDLKNVKVGAVWDEFGEILNKCFFFKAKNLLLCIIKPKNQSAYQCDDLLSGGGGEEPAGGHAPD